MIIVSRYSVESHEQIFVDGNVERNIHEKKGNDISAAVQEDIDLSVKAKLRWDLEAFSGALLSLIFKPRLYFILLRLLARAVPATSSSRAASTPTTMVLTAGPLLRCRLSMPVTPTVTIGVEVPAMIIKIVRPALCILISRRGHQI